MPYYNVQIALKKQIEKLIKELRNIDQERVIFVPMDNIAIAFKNFYGDEQTYKLTFDIIKMQFLKR